MTDRPGLRLARPAMASAKPTRRVSGSLAAWTRTLWPDSAANTVTADCVARRPRETCSGSQGLAASCSAKQSEYFPAQPWVDWSSTPGWQPRPFSSTSRRARPMVALARTPGPKRFPPPCRPIASRTGPLTITMSAAPPVLVAGPWSVNAGSPMARSAAPTTGKYSGRQPAMTALIAACHAVTARSRTGSWSSTASAGHGPPASIRSTSAAVGGTTGSPSVQPWAKQASTACQGSSTSRPGYASSLTSGSGRERRAGGRPIASIGGPALLVAPHLLHPAPVIDRVVRDEVLHMRPHREVVESPEQDGTDGGLFQLPLDVLHQRHPLLRIQLLGLLVEEPRHLLAAEAGIVPGRPAAEVLVEIGVRVVRLHPVAVDAELELSARLERSPLWRIHLPKRGVDPDTPELVDHERADVHEGREPPGQDLDLQGLARTEARLGEERPGLGLLATRLAVAREGAEIALQHSPDPVGARHHRASEHGRSLIDGGDQGPPVDSTAQGLTHRDVVEGRLAAVDGEVIEHARVHLRDHELRGCLLQLIGDGLRGFTGERHVDAPRLERRGRCAALGNDQVAQAVEVGPALHEVVGVLHVLEELALAPLLDLERPRAHA